MQSQPPQTATAPRRPWRSTAHTGSSSRFSMVGIGDKTEALLLRSRADGLFSYHGKCVTEPPYDVCRMASAEPGTGKREPPPDGSPNPITQPNRTQKQPGARPAIHGAGSVEGRSSGSKSVLVLMAAALRPATGENSLHRTGTEVLSRDSQRTTVAIDCFRVRSRCSAEAEPKPYDVCRICNRARMGWTHRRTLHSRI